MQGEGGNFCEQGFALDVAVGAEAGGDAVEVGVVVAGVAAEFVGSCVGEGLEDFVERGGVEMAGG